MGKSVARALDPNVPFRPAGTPFFYGWIIVGASVMGMATSMPGQTIGVGPFNESLLANLDLTRIQLSLAYGIGTTISGLTLPRMGRYFDRFGARLTGTVVEVVFGLALIYMAGTATIYHGLKPADAPAPWLAMIILTFGFFLIRFLGQGVISLVSRAMVGKWFNRKRGMASAISGCFGAILFSISPVVLYKLVEWLGWQGAWLATGLFMIFVMSGLCWLIYRDNPEECGLEMDGEPAPVETTGPTDPEFTIYREFTGPEAVRTYAFWAFTAAFTLMGIFSTAIGFHAEDIARELGVSSAYYFSLFFWMACVNVPVGFLIGWLTGKMRLKKLLSVMAVSMGLQALGLLHLSHTWGVVLYIVSGGLAMAFFGNLMAVAYPRFFGRKHLGAVSGWSMLSLVIGSAAAPLIWSLTKAALGDYTPALWGFIVVCIVLLAASTFADNPQRRLSPGV